MVVRGIYAASTVLTICHFYGILKYLLTQDDIGLAISKQFSPDLTMLLHILQIKLGIILPIRSSIPRLKLCCGFHDTVITLYLTYHLRNKLLQDNES